MTTWLTVEQISELSGTTPQWIRKLISIGEFTTRLSDKSSANGRRPVLVALESAPTTPETLQWWSTVQAEYAKRHQALVPVTPQALLFNAAGEAEVPTEIRLTPQQSKEADRRLAIIQPLLDWDKGIRPLLFTDDGTPITSKDQLTAFIAAKEGEGRSTLWNWIARYRQQGYLGLVRKQRADGGKSKFFEQYSKAAEYVQFKYFGLFPDGRPGAEKLSITAVFYALKRDWSKLYNHGSEPPSYATVRDYLVNYVPKPVSTFAREGARAYENTHELKISRKITDVAVNQIWISDHRQMDVFVRNDWFPYIAKDKWLRIWITMFIDYRSHRPICWSWSVNPSSRSLASALRIGFAKFGLPQALLIDNGKDYQKIGQPPLSEFEPATAGLLHRLGIKSQFCTPRRPRAKFVESFFGVMSKQFDPIWGSAYAGRDAKKRSEECNVAMRQHELYVRGERNESPLPTVSEFIACADTWMEQDYANAPSEGRACQGKSPAEVFDAALPEKSRQPVPVVELEPLFWEQKRCSVRGSKIQLHKCWYEGVDAMSQARLRLSDGREVMVACDPDNLGLALAFDMQHNFLARLRAEKLLEHGPVSQEAVKDHERANKAFRREIRNYQTALAARVAGAYGVTTELAHLRQRAGVTKSQPVLSPATVRPLPLAAVNGQPAFTASTDTSIDRREIARTFAEED
jgi:hypothetical protein